MDRAIRNLAEITGCTIEQAIATVTTHPAALMHLSDRGSLQARGRADVVLLDPDANVVATMVAGQIAYLATPERLNRELHDPT
jgi:N-acetylglucosamine-6-phosphate deacetylase